MTMNTIHLSLEPVLNSFCDMPPAPKHKAVAYDARLSAIKQYLVSNLMGRNLTKTEAQDLIDVIVMRTRLPDAGNAKEQQ